MKDWDESNEQESEGKRLLRFEKRAKRVSETKREKRNRQVRKRKFDEKERINLRFIEFIYLHTRARHNCHLCYHFS